MGLYSEKGLASGKTFLFSSFLKFNVQIFRNKMHFSLHKIFLDVFLDIKAMKKHFIHIASAILVILSGISMPVYGNEILKDDNLVIRAFEAENSEDLSSSWKASEDFLKLIDSYSSFIFRTKKSQTIEKVNFVLEVNSFGRIVGFELLNEADKGLKERLDFVIRQLPDFQPVLGASNFKPEKLEVIIQK